MGMRRQSDTEVERTPRELVDRRRDFPKLLIGRGLAWASAHIDLEMAAAEYGKKVARKREVIVDRLLPLRWIDKICRLSWTSVRTRYHRDTVAIEDIFQSRWTIDPLHREATVGLDARE